MGVRLTLYFAPGSSSMAPHIALHEIGAPFEARPISFDRKENRTSEYLAINPEGKVPTLVIDGRPLTEVAAILFYLTKRFPAAPLFWPTAPEEEAYAVSWLSFLASTLHPARRKGIDHARHVFDIADRRLEQREWALDRFSVVDIHLFRLYWRFGNSLKQASTEFSSLSAHYDRMMARPAVQKTCQIESDIGYELR